MSGQVKPAFVEFVRGRAVETLLKEGELSHCQVVLEAATGLTVALIETPDPRYDRRIFYARAGIRVAMEHPGLGQLQRASFAAEAWAVTCRDRRSPPRDLSTHPARREVLVIHLWEAQGDVSDYLEFAMLRDASGQLVDIAEVPESERPKLRESLLADLLGGYEVARQLLPMYLAGQPAKERKVP